MKRKRFWETAAMLILACVLAACTGKNSGQAGSPAGAGWPTKTVTFYVATSAGGATDLMARQIADYFQRRFGKPFPVVNLSGSGGQIAMDAIMHSDADGSAFLFWHVSSLVSNVSGTLPLVIYNELDPVCITVANDIMPLFVRADSDIKSFADLAAKVRANPGKIIFGGNTGAYPNILCLGLADAIGGSFTWVHTGDDSQNTAALLGGQVDIINQNYGMAKQYIDNGDWRVLGLLSDERSPNHPAISTAKEEGVNFSIPPFFYAIWGTKGTPRAVYDKFNEGIQEFLKNDEMMASLNKLGLVYNYMPQDEAAKYMKDFHESIQKYSSLFVKK
jgi:tripartite-type tricarboxylate transporter receptor subunit TctC